MTFSELCARLRKAGIEDDRREAALLLEHFCARPLSSTDDEDYKSADLERAVASRCQHTPLQYLLGKWPFFRQTYFVSPDCLIPRSDTEVLVEEAIRVLPQGAYFADLCTGSGCIGISVLCERPDTSCYAVDKFFKTVCMAIQNAAAQGVGDRFHAHQIDLFEDADIRFSLIAPFDAILSNPPYIPSAVIPTLSPEVQAEPVAALDGGEDGLAFYRKILTFSRFLKPGGRMILEIGYDQAEAVTELAKHAGFTEIRVLKDLGGNDRVVSMIYPGA